MTIKQQLIIGVIIVYIIRLPLLLNAVLMDIKCCADKKRLVTFFCDIHDENFRIDNRQLKDFKTFLLERAQKNLRPLHILLETPSEFVRTSKGASVLTSLAEDMTTYLGYPLRNIFFEDIEIRCVAVALMHILHRKGPSYFDPNSTIETSETSCVFQDICFADLLNEFMHHINLLQRRQIFMGNRISDEGLHKILQSIAEKHELLMNCMHRYQIRLDEPVKEKLQGLYMADKVQCDDGTTVSYEDFRANFHEIIINLFAALLDLHITNKILSLPEDHDIAVLVGLGHADRIENAFTYSTASPYSMIPAVGIGPNPKDPFEGISREQIAATLIPYSPQSAFSKITTFIKCALGQKDKKQPEEPAYQGLYESYWVHRMNQQKKLEKLTLLTGGHLD